MSDLVERLRKLTGDVPPRGHVVLAEEAAARLEQLEAALRAIIIRCEEGDKKSDWLPTISNIARAALAQSSPPMRQENDDVFKGFRGNNEA
jgi:hypothetical protein